MQMQVVKEKREEKLERPIYGAEHFGLIFCVASYMTDSTLHNHPESQMNAFMEGLGVGLDDEDNSDYEDDQFTSGWFVMDFPSPSIPMTYSMNLTLSLKCSSSANIYRFSILSWLFILRRSGIFTKKTKNHHCHHPPRMRGVDSFKDHERHLKRGLSVARL